ncbi:protein translocase subunit SecF [Pseudohongiella sp. SYSU M77423]|uniref:protein translocase subunit SecF n=1 Tax=Pseudohongiella sp. SYSU M77423 TaxID=3042312 RepID=UPI00248006D1|nr:protein translocase subunit SecF [Pseudohongiella sp. SYSU M77423]MDH7943656.1 protein translocase subunit SecF [Pseudohongiella sp. SYSU M77423]
MALIKSDIDFMSARKRRITGIISTVMLVVAILSLAINRFEFGLDFTSGTLIEVGYPQSINPEDVRQQLISSGFEDAVVVAFGSDRDLLVRLPVEESADDLAAASAASSLGNEVLAALQEASDVPVEMRRSEYVGPKVGEELAEQGALALLVALGIVMLYVAVRFQYKFAVASVAALAHDVIVVLGIISLFHLTFDLTVLAALLAVIGYSLNDTIVVFDRARENFRTMRSTDSEFILNTTLNQVISRTFVTSLTTLLALFAMLLMGGESIRGFAVSLIVGVSVGTYTSLHISCNFLMYLKIDKEDLAVPIKEGEEVDSLP